MIFNALIIVLLIPLALRGVKYRPIGAAALLPRQSAGLWGRRDYRAVLGIKLIDMGLVVLHLI